MRTGPRLAFGAAIVVVAALSMAHAEVSAELDSAGNYLRTVIIANASTRNVKVWAVGRSRADAVPLNPYGDANGDLWPVIEENPMNGRLPWVVWSRFNGRGFDLAWSNFSKRAWSPLSWVESASTAGDDLDPDVSFDVDGRPHLAWWRNENGVGRVYLSLFLVTHWMAAYPVSDPGVDSINPEITVLSDRRIQVDYDTPAGHVTRIITFNRPSTITDDIEPFGRMKVTETTTTPTLR